MTITITLPPEMERLLCERAALSGQDVSTFVLEAVKEKIEKLLTFDQIFEPLRKEVEASGVTDDELEALCRQAREEVWQEKQGRLSKGS